MSHLQPARIPTGEETTHNRCLAVYRSGIGVPAIELDAGGVIGDKHYGKDPLRAVMLASTLAYDKAAQNGIALAAGALEENILVPFDPYSLPLGTRIHLGEAVVELAQYGTICRSLTRIDSKLPKLLKGERGIFARVIRPGTVREGDPVRIELTGNTGVSSPVQSDLKETV